MITGTYDGSNVNVYIDGVYKGSVAAAGPISYLPSSSQYVAIGYLISGGGTVGAGSLSNAQFYNVSLDASQIQALYLEGIGGAPVLPANVVGWWPLNGDTNDYSGNNNNGAPTSIAYTSQWLSGYTTP